MVLCMAYQIVQYLLITHITITDTLDREIMIVGALDRWRVLDSHQSQQKTTE